MNIWLTGTSGFIGGHLIRKLTQDGFKVRAFSNNPKYKKQNTEIIFMDYSSTKSIEALINKLGCPDRFIHIAWADMTIPMSERHLTYNIHNSNNLIQTFLSSGLDQFIFLGSINEYGSPLGPIDESTPPTGRIINYALGKSKVTKFGMLKSSYHNKSFLNIRPSYVYGQGQRPNSLINHLFESSLSKTLPTLGPCDYYRDYIYVKDVVEGICRLMKVQSSGIVNLGSGSCVIVKDFVERFWHFLGEDVKNLSFGEKEMMKDEPDQNKSFMNINKLRELTDWEPSYTLDEGIMDSIADKKLNNKKSFNN